jgi:hypothetical protein
MARSAPADCHVTSLLVATPSGFIFTGHSLQWLTQKNIEAHPLALCTGLSLIKWTRMRIEYNLGKE